MISKRIKTIATLINDKQSVLDIGCDHGYLGQELRKRGNDKLIICADNKIGPLNNAKSNLSFYKNIDYVLSDGAVNVKKVVDVAVMAGMGYHTVEHILTQAKEYFDLVHTIIIQVNTDVDKMRKWLIENDFKIINEEIIFEYKYYQILVVEHGKQNLSDKEITYGPYLLKNHSSIFEDYLNDQIDKNKMILDKLDESHPDHLIIENRIKSHLDILKEVSDNF